MEIVIITNLTLPVLPHNLSNFVFYLFPIILFQHYRVFTPFKSPRVAGATVFS